MAYGNWGAFVYKNGERQTEWEDNTPYRENELIAGYWQAFGRKEDGERISPHHAVLGKDRVRVCGHKAYFMLYLDGKEVEDTDQYLVSGYDTDEDTNEKLYDADKALYQGEVEGYKFRAQMFDGNMIDLELIEPDGTCWQSRCGYAFGAGWPDNSEGNRYHNAMPWTDK
jgi:hypothetical protein